MEPAEFSRPVAVSALNDTRPLAVSALCDTRLLQEETENFGLRHNQPTHTA